MRQRTAIPWVIPVAVVGAVILGLLVAKSPSYGIVFILAGAFGAIFFASDRQALPYVALGFLLCVPFDFLGPFSETLQGFPVFAIALGGAVLSILAPRRRLGEVGASAWDVWLLSGALFITFTINGLAGGVRQALMLVAGVLFYLWIRLAYEGGSRAKRLFLNTILIVGVIQGLAAVAERLVGASTFASLIPTYVPAIKEFTSTLGTRAVSLAGHPLRLGAIEMSGVVAGFALSRGTHGRQRALASAAIAVCAVGLLLSGARGAWLSTFAGALALLIITPGTESLKLAVRLTVGGVIGWVLLNVTGVLSLVSERLFGAASRPASVGQRIGVLASTSTIWRERPLQGYGFGTYLQEIYAQGFTYSNTENQYIDFLLAGGALTLSSFLVLCGRGVGTVWRNRNVTLVPALGGVLVAWIVGIGTFNAFSWSAAFPFFMAILATVADSADA